MLFPFSLFSVEPAKQMPVRRWYWARPQTLLLTLALWLPVAAPAQPCEPGYLDDARTLDAATRYRQRPNGERCEGFHRSAVSNRLELVCLLVVSVGLSWRPGGVPVVIALAADDLELELAADWQSDDPRVSTRLLALRSVDSFIDFAGSGSANNPTELLLRPDGRWRLAGLDATALMLRRDLPGQARPEPSLLGGTLHLRDTDRTLTLHAGDWLRLGAIDSERLGLVLVPAGADGAARIEPRLAGRVDRVETGPDLDQLPNLAPTLLEYLIHQQTLGLVWGALAFLWGLFVGVRAWVGGKD